MKVTYLIDQFPHLTETFVLNQITGLIERGVDVQIFALTPGETKLCHPDITKYKLLNKTKYFFEHRLSHNRLLRILQIFYRVFRHLFDAQVRRALFNLAEVPLGMRIYLASAVATIKPASQRTLTIAHFGPTAVLANRLTKIGIFDGIIVPIFHGFDLSEKKVLQHNQGGYRQLFELCPKVLTISEHWRTELINLGCNADKILVNRMGINPDIFSVRALNSQLSAKLKLLTVARLTEKKGLTYAIDAIAALIKLNYKVQLDIIGTGPLRDSLQQQINTLQLQQFVRLVGAKTQPEIREQLMQADLFLLPSVTAANGDKEGIPVSLMEAMATGCICLSTYHSGIPELITHNQNGLLVAERDSEAICREIVMLIKGKKDIVMLRRNARQTVVSGFNQQQLYDDFVDLCRHIGASNVQT